MFVLTFDRTDLDKGIRKVEFRTIVGADQGGHRFVDSSSFAIFKDSASSVVPAPEVFCLIFGSARLTVKHVTQRFVNIFLFIKKEHYRSVYRTVCYSINDWLVDWLALITRLAVISDISV